MSSVNYSNVLDMSEISFSKRLERLWDREYHDSIFDQEEIRYLILEQFDEIRALRVLNRMAPAAWTIFEGRKCITTSEVATLLGMKRNSPKTYRATNPEEMKKAGGEVLHRSRLKDFFESSNKRQLYPGRVSSLSIYTPESVLLMAMLANRMEKCRLIRSLIGQELGLIPYQQTWISDEYDQTPSGREETGDASPDSRKPKPLAEVFEQMDREFPMQMVDLSGILRSIDLPTESVATQEITVPLVEGISASVFIARVVQTDDVMDFFRKYESSLAEGVSGIIYCHGSSLNADLVTEIVEQAGYRIKIVSVTKS